jgi:hypothetical protein
LGVSEGKCSWKKKEDTINCFANMFSWAFAKTVRNINAKRGEYEMVLASLGHDDIQYWLTIKENRDKVAEALKLEYDNQPFRNYTTLRITKEFRLKFPYEHEIFIDIFETRERKERLEDGEEWRIAFHVLWEIKPVLTNLGEVLRQIRKYREILNRAGYIDDDDFVILVYNTSPTKNEVITQYFNSEGIDVYQILPSECKRLEDL